MKFQKLDWVAFAFIIPLWIGASSLTLRSVDGVIYASVAKNLSQISLWNWAAPTWHEGVLFREHPPLFMWSMAILFKIFGVSTLTAKIPALIFSSLTVLFFHSLVKELFDKRYAILFLFLILLDFKFMKHGRGSMLEVPTMCFFTFSLLSIVRYHKAEYGRKIHAALAGGAILGAILSKGIVGIMPMGVYIFYSFAIGKREIKPHIVWLSIVLSIVALFLGLFDLWHYLLTGDSFWKNYLFNQVSHSLQGRGAGVSWPLLFYLKEYFRNFPLYTLFPFIAPFALFFVKNNAYKNGLMLGLVYLACLLSGFSLSKHTAAWYLNVHFPGTWLVVGSLILIFLDKKINYTFLKNAALSLISCLLLLSSFFPALFSTQKRSVERFLDGASKLSTLTHTKRIRDCVGLNAWKRDFLINFYLSAKRVNCDANGPFALLKSEQLDKNGNILHSFGDLHLVKK